MARQLRAYSRCRREALAAYFLRLICGGLADEQRTLDLISALSYHIPRKSPAKRPTRLPMVHNRSTSSTPITKLQHPVDPRVVEMMAPYWQDSFGNPHSSDHIIGWQAAKVVDQSKVTVAGLIGADPDEIIFTSGATEANNLALFGLARRATPAQRRILIGATEHKCVLAAARALEARENFTVQQIPVDKEGFIDLDALADQIDETTLVVSIMAVNNEVGTVQDIPRIAELAASAASFSTATQPRAHALWT